MEFYINHTRQEIFRIPSEEWEEDDNIEKEMIDLDDEDQFFMIVKLVDDYGYYMEPEDRNLFMKDIEMERLLNEQYDEMLRKEEENNQSDSFNGWDEPGASFDY